jgi:aldehyde dehydrogenase (NAD+)
MIKNYINGEWVNSTGTETVEVINPANEEVLALSPLGTSKDVEKAVMAAKEAFKKSHRSVPVEYI